MKALLLAVYLHSQILSAGNNASRSSPRQDQKILLFQCKLKQYFKNNKKSYLFQYVEFLTM
ncbi:MAG: hypothetical protein FD166_3084 [Bacteroidetes bacterium]|nr:MAG: hypothetical protein FD166_3084 [Bacteroidota bacterium]